MPTKRILLITANYAPEPNGTGKYNGEMIRWLAAKGYDCTVLTTYPFYPQWKIQPPYTRHRFWYKKEKEEGITVLRCPQYTPATPSGRQRILQELTFAVSAFLRLLCLLPAPRYDVVMTVAPPFHLGLLGVLYRRIRGSRCVHHVQDMQIEAARDLGMIRSAGLIRFLFRLEKYMLRHTQVVSSISENMIQKISAKTGTAVTFFPNWANIQLFHPIHNRAGLKKEFGFEEDERIVLYAGAIGEKQGLEAILHAAVAFSRDPGVRFIICGSGPYRLVLEAQSLAMGLQQVIFFDTQPYERFNRFLNMADLHLVIQKESAGDLVMPSKLTTILAVGGLALVTANKGTSLHELVSRHGIGLVIDAEDQEALNEAIRKAVYNEQEHITRKAREYARNYLAIDEIMQRYEAAVIKVSI